jgi:hypothetical protein
MPGARWKVFLHLEAWFRVGRGIPHSEGLGMFVTRYLISQNKCVKILQIEKKTVESQHRSELLFAAAVSASAGDTQTSPLQKLTKPNI